MLPSYETIAGPTLPPVHQHPAAPNQHPLKKQRTRREGSTPVYDSQPPPPPTSAHRRPPSKNQNPPNPPNRGPHYLPCFTFPVIPELFPMPLISSQVHASCADYITRFANANPYQGLNSRLVGYKDLQTGVISPAIRFGMRCTDKIVYPAGDRPTIQAYIVLVGDVKFEPGFPFWITGHGRWVDQSWRENAHVATNDPQLQFAYHFREQLPSVKSEQAAAGTGEMDAEMMEMMEMESIWAGQQA